MPGALDVLLGQRPLLPRRHTGSSTPPLLTFPASKLTAKIMLAFGANPSADPRTSFSWTDVTQYVLQANGIRIRRGRADEQTSQTQPSQCTLTFRNQSGRFSPRNPNGPYYGTFGKNTPLRVDVDPGTGWVTRFTGFVSEWPPSWDLSDRYNAVQVTANGILRRIGQGSAPIDSLAKSEVLYVYRNSTTVTVTGYWPLEDGSSSTSAASAIGGAVMTTSGTVHFDAVTPPAGSAAAPNVSAGTLYGTVAAATSAAWGIDFYFQAGGACRLIDWTTTTGVTFSIDITSTTVTMNASDGTSAPVTVAVADGAWHVITATGTGSSYTIFVDGSSLAGNSLSSLTVGNLGLFRVNPTVDADLTSVGHVITNNTSASTISSLVLTGFPGVLAGLNFNHVAANNGVVNDPVGYLDSELMGPIPVGSLLDVLNQCVLADEGFMVERLTGVLGFDAHTTRENQPVALALDYAQRHIQPPLQPTDDDQRVRNDVSITRTSASTARYIDQSTSTLGVNTVGRYDTAATLDVYTDAQALQHAAYQVIHGTVDELRFPRVNLNFTHNPGLIASWLACDIGDRVTISNPPADLPPDTIDQVIEGYVEVIDPYIWAVELNLSPFSPHRIFRTSTPAGDPNDFIGYMIPVTCTLAAAIDTVTTTVTVTSDTLWSTNADDWTPAVPVLVDGERMTVSAVSGGSNPQTLTVARSVNTVVKSHVLGATLTFATPGVMGL